jgi:hypothetical protein
MIGGTLGEASFAHSPTEVNLDLFLARKGLNALAFSTR